MFPYSFSFILCIPISPPERYFRPSAALQIAHGETLVFPLVFQWCRAFVAQLKFLVCLFLHGFITVFEVTVSSPQGCPCPPPRAAGKERCAHGETLVLSRFSKGFVDISSPGTRRGGTRERGHAFCSPPGNVDSACFYKVLSLFSRYPCPHPAPLPVAPWRALCDFAWFYKVSARFPAGPPSPPKTHAFCSPSDGKAQPSSSDIHVYTREWLFHTCGKTFGVKKLPRARGDTRVGQPP